MSQLLIRGTKIEDVTIKCSRSGQMSYEIKCRSAWSDVVCREMHWTEEPEGFGNGNLDGKLAGVNMILEPTSKLLRDYRFDIKISQVSKFKHVAKIKNGEVEGRELEFVVTTTEEDAPQILSAYMAKCNPGDDRGQCKLVYSAEEQTTLGEGGAPEEKPRGRRKAAEAEAAGAVQ